MAGELWDGLVPYWENENHMFLAPSQAQGGIMWVVSSGNGSYNMTLATQEVEEDIQRCPYKIDNWVYEWANNWYKDDTLQFSCTEA